MIDIWKITSYVDLQESRKALINCVFLSLAERDWAHILFHSTQVEDHTVLVQYLYYCTVPGTRTVHSIRITTYIIIFSHLLVLVQPILVYCVLYTVQVVHYIMWLCPGRFCPYRTCTVHRSVETLLATYRTSTVHRVYWPYGTCTQYWMKDGFWFSLFWN